MTSPEQLVELLKGARLQFVSESDLQAAIADALDAAGIAYEREVRLRAADRIDFLVGNVGVEVKVAGTDLAAARQMQRYAASPSVEALVLATTKPAHLFLDGRPLVGVPVHVALIAGGAL